MNSVSKKPIIGGIILAAIIGVVFVGAQINPDNPENEEVWSTRIAGPEYADISNHRYALITLERKVPYEFDFVATGDSPEEIRITVKLLNYYNPGDKTVFSEYFYKEGTLVDTGISQYYSWGYT